MIISKQHPDKNFILRTKNGSLEINEQNINIELIRVSDKIYHLLYNNRSFLVENILINKSQKTIELKINNKIINFTYKTDKDILLEKIGLNTDIVQKEQTLNAPIPGLILKILISENQKIEEGEPLLILEAMKMENIIKSVRSGIIKTIYVKQGDKVEKGSNLLLIQPDR